MSSINEKWLYNLKKKGYDFKPMMELCASWQFFNSDRNRGILLLKTINKKMKSGV